MTKVGSKRCPCFYGTLWTTYRNGDLVDVTKVRPSYERRGRVLGIQDVNRHGGRGGQNLMFALVFPSSILSETAACETRTLSSSIDHFEFSS